MVQRDRGRIGGPYFEEDARGAQVVRQPDQRGDIRRAGLAVRAVEQGGAGEGLQIAMRDEPDSMPCAQVARQRWRWGWRISCTARWAA